MNRLEELVSELNDKTDELKLCVALRVEAAYQQGKEDGLKQAQLERLRDFVEEQQ